MCGRSGFPQPGVVGLLAAAGLYFFNRRLESIIRQRTKELRESESKLADAVRVTRLGYWDLDLETMMFTFSDSFFAIFRTTAAEMGGYTMSAATALKRFVHPEEPSMVDNEIRKSLEAKGPHIKRYLEHRMLYADGSVGHIAVHYVILFDGSGKPVRLRGVNQDITEQKEAHEVSKRFSRAIEDSLNEVYMFDAATLEFMEVNRGARENLGYSMEELRQMTPLDLKPEFTRATFQNLIKLLQSGEKKILQFETVHRRKDGSQYPVSVNLQLIRGTTSIFVALILDITERKQAERLQARLATVVEQAEELIIITDADGIAEYVNPGFERISGYDKAEVVGRNLSLLKSGKHDSRFYYEIWEALKRGEVWRGRIVNRRKNGTLWEDEGSISPVRDHAGNVVNYVSIRRDVTREAKLEEQLRQSQKMDAVGQLAGGIAHDFNNLLASMMINLHLLIEDEQVKGESREELNEVMKCVERAAGLTRQLLMYSRKSVLEIQVLDLSDVVENLLAMLRRLLGENIRLVFERHPEPCPMEMDVNLLQQVLMNLTLNARDAMPQGGQIIVTTTTVQLSELEAQENPNRRPGRFAMLSVSDTGCGMDEGVLSQIFEPFFTTKEPGKGTGLGLATVYGIVTQQKGWVEADSRLGQGTCIRVYFPLSTSLSKPQDEPRSKRIPRGHETVLLVEDDTSLRTSLSRVLNRLGYRVLEASNGRDGMMLWEQHEAEISLLFTDMIMPGGMSGMDLVDQLRKRRPDLKVIVSSGHSSEIRDTTPLMALGIWYLPKPFQLSEMGEIVRACLDGKKPVLREEGGMAHM